MIVEIESNQYVCSILWHAVKIVLLGKLSASNHFLKNIRTSENKYENIHTRLKKQDKLQQNTTKLIRYEIIKIKGTFNKILNNREDRNIEVKISGNKNCTRNV